MVVITHNMYDVFEVADRITVLRLGQQVGVFNRKEVDTPQTNRLRDYLRGTALMGRPG